MKILFASRKPLYPAGAGGGEVSVHQLLVALKEMGHGASALGLFDIPKIENIAEDLQRTQTRAKLSEKRGRVPVGGDEIWDYPASLSMTYEVGPKKWAYATKMVLPGDYDAALEEQIGREHPDWVLVQADEWYGSFETMKAIPSRPRVALYLRNGREFDYRGDPVSNHPEDVPDAVIANSEFIKQVVRKRHGIEADVIHPGFDLKEYEVAQDRGRRRYVTFVNPVKEKGVETFLKLAMGMPEVEFLCVEGWGTIEPVRRFIEKLPNITYTPRQESMRRVYERSKVVIIPSLWEEAFGRVAVEAQASGCAVVASRRGGLPEAVGRGGILVDRYDDPGAWIEQIQKLLGDEQLRETLVEAGRQNARRFSSKAAAQKLLNVLNQRLQNSGVKTMMTE